MNESLGGLAFNGNNVDISERTSFQLFEKWKSLPGDSLVISFEISLYGDYSIGHILTCKNECEDVFNLIVSQESSKKDSLFFNLNVTRLGQKIVIPVSRKDLRRELWHSMCLSIDNVRKSIKIRFDDTVRDVGFEDSAYGSSKDMVKYVFGVCDHYLDAFPFAIRNLKYVGDSKKYFFPLGESSGEVAHSTNGEISGLIRNPEWLYRTHMKWRKIQELPETEIAAVCLDTTDNLLYLYTSSHLYVYTVATDEMTINFHPYGEMFRFSKGGGVNYEYYDDSGELILINNNRITGEPATLARYNTLTDSIIAVGDSHLGGRYHHNSVFKNNRGDRIYQFGGFARMQYHNSFHVLDTSTLTWDVAEFSGAVIEPRFYTSVGAGTGEDSRDIYLYGGYGNETGRQDDGGKYFYDLFRINPEEKVVEEIYDFNLGNFDKVPCRDLIVKADEKVMYTMCYSQYMPSSSLALFRFDWGDGSCMAVSDSIPFLSQKISTQVHLFESRLSKCLICVIQEFSDSQSSTIKLYKLSTPLAKESIMFTPGEPQGRKLTIIAVIVLGALISCLLIVIYKRRSALHIEVHDVPDEDECVAETEEINAGDEHEAGETDKMRNSVLMFGDFTIFDRQGRDVTYLFSSKLRQLFFLIFFHTFRKNSSGISSNEISSVIWPDKELTKSRNIRAVTIKNLRDALSGVDGITLVGSGGKWYFEIDQEVCFCDVLKVLGYKPREVSEYNVIRPYIHILRRGSILKTESYDWLDLFKSDMEESILRNFSEIMVEAYENGRYLISYKISQVLLLSDSLNDELMKYEVRSLIGLGEPVKARMRFRQFSVNYYEAYGVSIQFEDYVSSH